MRWIGPLTAIGVITLCSAGMADVYPSHPITIVVPWPAGGPSDAVARVIAEPLSTSLGQPVIVENIAGASGSIGVGHVARAKPDGYTLSLGNWPTHVINGAALSLNYDVLKDFAPISLLANNPLIIVSRKTLPANNLAELIAWLKANRGKATMGTSGIGSATHLAGQAFTSATGTQVQFVPYRGAAPAIQDLIAGQIDIIIDLASNALPHIKAGTIKAYAVAADRRLTLAPQIPTVDEEGLREFHISTWHALFAPKNTPEEVLQKLNRGIMDALANSSVRSKLTALGQEIPARKLQTTKALHAYQQAEIEKWWPIIKAAAIKSDH